MLGSARFLVVSGQETIEFVGTDLDEAPAADFSLANQFGELVSLKDQRRKVTVLTFLYTNCPDVCPLTAARLRNVHEQLGAQADQVAFLAVSVDPKHDTVEAARAFSERLDMPDEWSYLVGSRPALEPIWDAYYIGVAGGEIDEGHDHADHGGDQSADLLVHTAPIYLIDGEGQLRSLHTTGGETDAIVDDVLHDIRALLNES
jgi:protein SCO1/2